MSLLRNTNHVVAMAKPIGKVTRERIYIFLGLITRQHFTLIVILNKIEGEKWNIQ